MDDILEKTPIPLRIKLQVLVAHPATSELRSRLTSLALVPIGVDFDLEEVDRGWPVEQASVKIPRSPPTPSRGLLHWTC